MIRPSVISSRPATIRIAVDLPHPDGPTRTRNSSFSTSMLRSETAFAPPPAYRLPTPSKITRAIPGLLPVDYRIATDIAIRKRLLPDIPWIAGDPEKLVAASYNVHSVFRSF